MNKERLFKDYRSYLSTVGLHEVFAVDYIAKLGERYGLDVYRFRDKLVALVRHGDEFDISFGANVIVSHLDSPRLDVLVGEPLVEKEDGVFLKVIPYGGIIPQSWLDIPLVLVGRIYTDEKPIVINTTGEFEFTITSLLPHLDGRKELEKFSMNNLVVRVGNSKKENVLELLKERYGIHEDDLELADLSFVPATGVRELGFDKELITGYGHDDSCCAFTSLQALLDSDSNAKTQIAIFASYEETGSNQATGCNSEFIDDIFLNLANGDFRVAREAIRNSMIISADVCAGFESTYASHFEDSAKAVVGHGVGIIPYLGRKRGNDTDFHFRALIKQLALDNDIKYQIETTKVTEGGGGTVSTFFTTKGSYVIDVGVPVLAMHSPQEVISKTDLFETYRLYKVFFELGD